MVSSECGIISNSDTVCEQSASEWPGASTVRNRPIQSGRSIYTAVIKRRGTDLWCGAYRLGELLLHGHYT